MGRRFAEGGIDITPKSIAQRGGAGSVNLKYGFALRNSDSHQFNLKLFI